MVQPIHIVSVSNWWAFHIQTDDVVAIRYDAVSPQMDMQMKMETSRPLSISVIFGEKKWQILQGIQK
jgi:hypothetical protein